jgi:hypothetical protein
MKTPNFFPFNSYLFLPFYFLLFTFASLYASGSEAVAGAPFLSAA